MFAAVNFVCVFFVGFARFFGWFLLVCFVLRFKIPFFCVNSCFVLRAFSLFFFSCVVWVVFVFSIYIDLPGTHFDLLLFFFYGEPY